MGEFRHEIKYFCSERELRLIESRIKAICQLDSHVDNTGQYTISSVYFDDYMDSYYYENENGTDPREKFRIRIYNRNMKRIMLECKQKCKGMTRKESCDLTEMEYQKVMSGECDWQGFASQTLLTRFLTLMKTKNLSPKVIVEYERTPYVYALGNVRLTFDRNIASSTDFANFGSEGMISRPIMPVNKHIFEVKYDEFLPDYLYNILQVQGLQRTNFSKYYLCRKYSIG